VNLDLILVACLTALIAVCYTVLRAVGVGDVGPLEVAIGTGVGAVAMAARPRNGGPKG